MYKQIALNGTGSPHLEQLFDALNLCLVGGVLAMQPPASLSSLLPVRHNTSLQSRKRQRKFSQ
jgi:hypothetical protein